jgi:hypothetical protein
MLTYSGAYWQREYNRMLLTHIDDCLAKQVDNPRFVGLHYLVDRNARQLIPAPKRLSLGGMATTRQLGFVNPGPSRAIYPVFAAFSFRFARDLATIWKLIPTYRQTPGDYSFVICPALRKQQTTRSSWRFRLRSMAATFQAPGPWEIRSSL